MIHLLDSPFVISYSPYISFPQSSDLIGAFVLATTQISREGITEPLSRWNPSLVCEPQHVIIFVCSVFSSLKKMTMHIFFLIFVCFKFFFLFLTSNLISSVKVIHSRALCHCFVWSLPLELFLSASGNWLNFHVLWFSKFLCFVKCKWIITLVHSVVDSLLVWI